MMDAIDEPEVVKAKLIEMGCPYTSADDRATVWLEGYQKGYDAASNQAIARLEQLAGKHQR